MRNTSLSIESPNTIAKMIIGTADWRPWALGSSTRSEMKIRPGRVGAPASRSESTSAVSVAEGTAMRKGRIRPAGQEWHSAHAERGTEEGNAHLGTNGGE
jgi:hypothetical protein